MRKSWIIGVMFIPLLLAAPASAQMRFLGPGHTGFSPHAGVTRTDESLGFGAGVDATVSDRVDLGLSIERIHLDEHFASHDASVTAVIPRLAIGLVRSAQSATDVELSVTYAFDTYTSDWLAARDRELDATRRTAMVSAYFTTRVSPALTFYPELGVGYMSDTRTYTGPDGDTDDAEETEFVFRVGASMLFHGKFRFTPAVLVIDGDATWTTTVGLVYSGG